MTEPVQMMLPFDCKECFMRGCECKCHTCRTAYGRNMRLTNLELTRLSVEAGMRESEAKQGRMLKGQGL